MLAACFDSCFEKYFIHTRGESAHAPPVPTPMGMDTNRTDGVLSPKFSADFTERWYAGITANPRSEIRPWSTKF